MSQLATFATPETLPVYSYFVVYSCSQYGNLMESDLTDSDTKMINVYGQFATCIVLSVLCQQNQASVFYFKIKMITMYIHTPYINYAIKANTNKVYGKTATLKIISVMWRKPEALKQQSVY